MGMAFGAGYMSVGISCFFMVMVANLILMKLSQKVEENSRYVSLYVEVEETVGVKKLRKKLGQMGYSISSMNKTKDKTLAGTDAALMIEVDYGEKHSHHALFEELNNLDYVTYVEEI